MQNEQALIQMLERIALALEKATPPSLGFGEAPTPKHVYIGADKNNNSCWYFYDVSRQVKIPIIESALTGILIGVDICVKEYKQKENPKVEFTVHADKAYILRSGLETTFTKCMLLALSQLLIDNPQALLKPLTISVSPGDEEVVFARIWCEGQQVRHEWKEINLLDTIHQIQAFFNPGIEPVKTQTKTQLIELTGEELARCGWEIDRAREFTKQVFGKVSRNQMNEDELQKFLKHLQSQPTAIPPDEAIPSSRNGANLRSGLG